ncbi:hypothetical protein V6C59_21065 [Acinetobacter bereziniae]|uniref:hypothetical protein n=1 Tax=Acinetobacter bereziniae TaxID=106648 RepID=UPI002FDB8BBF
MLKFILLLNVFFLVCACTQLKSSNDYDEIRLMDEYVEKQRKKLPIKNYELTKWVDIYREGNKMIYVYQLDKIDVNASQLNDIKKRYNSIERKKEFCKMIEKVINNPIILETKLLDVDSKILISVSFKSEDCRY